MQAEIFEHAFNYGVISRSHEITTKTRLLMINLVVDQPFAFPPEKLLTEETQVGENASPILDQISDYYFSCVFSQS